MLIALRGMSPVIYFTRALSPYDEVAAKAALCSNSVNWQQLRRRDARAARARADRACAARVTRDRTARGHSCSAAAVAAAAAAPRRRPPRWRRVGGRATEWDGLKKSRTIWAFRTISCDFDLSALFVASWNAFGVFLED